MEQYRVCPGVTIWLADNLGEVLNEHLSLLVGRYVCFQVRSNETYSEAKRQFSDRNRDVLMNVQSAISGDQLLSLLCSARIRHCLRLLVGVVNWCASQFYDLLSDHFDSKQSRESVDQPISYHPYPSLTPLSSGRVRSSALLWWY